MKYIPSKENVRICGRYNILDEVLYLGFSGAYVEFTTKASCLTIQMRTDTSKTMEIPTQLGVVAVWVNNKRDENGHAVFAARTALSETDSIVEAEIGEAGVEKTVKITKMSEAAFGLVGIKSIDTNGDFDITPTVSNKKKVEFIGDSITCGYGNEGKEGVDIFDTRIENPTDAYAILTAEALGYEYNLVSWSGIGIVTNWIPPEVNEPCEEILMPWLYPYRDVRYSERTGDAKVEWDFNEYKPDLIVINLGTNDDSYVREIKEREDYFAPKYYDFIDYVHTHNPQAKIVCCLGIMGRNLCKIEEEMVRKYVLEHPEAQVEYFAFPEQPMEGKAVDSHPNKDTHRESAKLLTQFIKDKGFN